VAPRAAAVPMFQKRMADVNGQTRAGELAIVVVAVAHRRLTWVHPFIYGNGRVARLPSQVLLQGLGLTNNVWSTLRGLVRSQPRYCELLVNADLNRRNDLDGRGNLSEEGLIAFCDYFLDICVDQAGFMAELPDMQSMKDRIAASLAFESHREESAIRMEVRTPMHYLFLGGPMDRGAFKAMIGLAPRSADRVLRALLARGLLTSDTQKGAIRFAVPLHALRFYFPALWPEAGRELLMALLTRVTTNGVETVRIVAATKKAVRSQRLCGISAYSTASSRGCAGDARLQEPSW